MKGQASQCWWAAVNRDSGACPGFHPTRFFCRAQILHQLAADQSCASIKKKTPRSAFIKGPCPLSVGGVPGCPLHPSCPWNAMTAPPRKAGGRCRGSGWTAAGGGCCLLETPEGCWETPGTTGAGSARAPRRWGGAVPSCHIPPPHRRGARQEVHPPSGPAGPRSAGCRDRVLL